MNQPSLSAAEIRQQLLLFDGKNVQPFRDVASRCATDDAAVRQLLAITKSSAASEEPVELGATWVVKNLAERRERALGKDLSGLLVAQIASVENAQSRLHLLQTLPYCDLGAASTRLLRELLPRLLESERHGLTRAWVFNGFAEVARCDASYRDTATSLLSEAYQGERAAVRARIRNALDDL